MSLASNSVFGGLSKIGPKPRKSSASKFIKGKLEKLRGRFLWRAAKHNPEQLEPSIFLDDSEGHTLKVNKDRQLLLMLKLHYMQ